MEIFATLRVAGVEYEVRMTSVEWSTKSEMKSAESEIRNSDYYRNSDSESEIFTNYLMRAPKRVTMPVLSTEIGNSKPILNREQSSSIFDGFVTIHWTYPFDNFPDPVNGIKPIIKNHFINWGFVDQGRVRK
mgnify:CR=1 FL=1